MVEIKGVEKFAPRDYPGFLSATVFVGGCNLRCPFCHNVDLVERPEEIPTFPADYFLSFLDSRKGWLEGVCISGGEPLLHKDLEELCTLIKERNFLVKIDTNGTYPERLEELIQEKLVDHIAMDVKAPLDKYEQVIKSNVDLQDVQRSIDLIRNSGLDYTFRTTVVPGLLDINDIRKIGEWLEGVNNFQIQQFVPERTLEESYRLKVPYTEEEIQEMVRAVEPFFSKIRIEGI